MKYQKKISVGQFVKKGEDFKDKDILVIANEGKQIEGQYGVQDVFLVKLPKGYEKNMNFNQTSINNIIDAYGPDSKNWIGKEVKVWLITQSVSGKLQKVAYLAHPSAELVEGADGMAWQIPGGKEKPIIPPGWVAPEDLSGYIAEIGEGDIPL